MSVADVRVIAQPLDRIDNHSKGRLSRLGVYTIRVFNRFKLAFAEEMQAKKTYTAQPTGRHACRESEARSWGYRIGKPQDDPVGSDC